MRNYQNMVFSTAMRLLTNQSEAEDVTQEVFLRAYERFGELQGSPTVGGWLKTVATNLSLNHLSRYRSRWKFFSEMFTGDPDAGVQDDVRVDRPRKPGDAPALNDVEVDDVVAFLRTLTDGYGL